MKGGVKAHHDDLWVHVLDIQTGFYRGNIAECRDNSTSLCLLSFSPASFHFICIAPTLLQLTYTVFAFSFGKAPRLRSAFL